MLGVLQFCVPLFFIESLQCIALVVKLKLKNDDIPLCLSACLPNHILVCSVHAAYMTHHKMTKYEYLTCMFSFVACLCFVCVTNIRKYAGAV